MRAFIIAYFAILILGLFAWSGVAFYEKDKGSGAIAGVGGCFLLIFFALLMSI